jgi:hypothetical protein
MVRFHATIALLTYATLAGFATFAGQSDVERGMSGKHFRLDALSEERYTSTATPYDKQPVTRARVWLYIVVERRGAARAHRAQSGEQL